MVGINTFHRLNCWLVKLGREVIYNLLKSTLSVGYLIYIGGKQHTLPCRPLSPDMPRPSWNECTRISYRGIIRMNSSWILSSTSLFTSRVSIIFLCESWNVRQARLDAICPQPAIPLPRCGVPRKTINFVRLRVGSDLRMAWESNSALVIFQSRRYHNHTSLTRMPPRL